jgi:hypothetical protein
MQRLINNVKEHEKADGKLKHKVERFSAFLTSKFEWDFEDEFEDAPTIVTLEDATISSERPNLKRKNANNETVLENEEEIDFQDEENEVMDVVGDLPMF